MKIKIKEELQDTLSVGLGLKIPVKIDSLEIEDKVLIEYCDDREFLEYFVNAMLMCVKTYKSFNIETINHYMGCYKITDRFQLRYVSENSEIIEGLLHRHNITHFFEGLQYYYQPLYNTPKSVKERKITKEIVDNFTKTIKLQDVTNEYVVGLDGLYYYSCW